MAPIKKRPSMRARNSTTKSNAATSKPSTTAPDAAFSAADLSSLRLKKQDKRHLKHAALMHKVRDASVSKASTKKRRRPGKKIAAAESLGGLRDALPEVEEDEEEGWAGLSEDDGMDESDAAVKSKRRRQGGAEGKIKMRSLKHRPGAMKRKQVLERREQERFAKNLAQLAGNERAVVAAAKTKGDQEANGPGKGHDQAQKWAALREFIGGTMEKDKAFGRA